MKTCLSDFAIAGGRPVFCEPLLVGRPGIPDRQAFLRRVSGILDSGHLTNGGPLVGEFEQRLQDYLGVRHAIAVCNGTAALQVMAMAAELSGEVIVPSMTFIATAHALQWMGLTPIFADIDEHTHTLNPVSVEQCVTSRTSAILAVHLWGNPCDARSLQMIADRHHLKLLFDASHAFGCRTANSRIGNFGHAEAFSFHATKVMHAFEGGAVVTNHAEIAERCRLMRNFGITGLCQIDSLGINAKMNELSAAAGLTSLENLPEVIRHNQRNLSEYRREFQDLPGLTITIPETEEDRNAQYVVARVAEGQFGLNRDQLLTVLRAEGVLARAYFVPGCHHAPPYAGNPKHTPVPLPVTDSLLHDVIQFPSGVSVDDSRIRRIGALLSSIRLHAEELREVAGSSTTSVPQTIRRGAA
ncbi:MAG: DegT/DnrJ/EryC1/StrS family aminotransferase [Planctomycetaceae bacterium]